MSWLGGLMLLIGAVWLLRDRRRLASPEIPVAPGNRHSRAWPWLVVIIGAMLLLYGLQARKPPAPLSFPSAQLAPSDRTLAGHIAFSFGDAKLVEGETRLLDMAAAAMKRHPSSTMTMRAKVYIGGASYDTPEDRRRRATAIRDHMVGAGISADRVFFDEEHDATQSLTPGTYLRAYSGVDFVVLWQ
jgi:hypothetical protein